MIKIIAKVSTSNSVLTYLSPDLYTIQQVAGVVPVQYQITIDSNTFLLGQGYTYGNYNVTYYVLDDTAVIDAEFKINSVNDSRLQCTTKIVNNIPVAVIHAYQSEYGLVSTTTRFLLADSDDYGVYNISVVDTLKYNYFDNLMFFRFNQPSVIELGKTCKLYKLVYEPIEVTEFIDAVVDDAVVAPFSEPSIMPTYGTMPAVYTQSLSSMALAYGTSSDFLNSLTSHIIATDVLYNTSDPSTFVHFGSNISRLQSFVNKYSAISASYNNTDIALYTNSAAYRADLASKIIDGFTYYERSLFYKFVDRDQLISQSVPDLDTVQLNSMVISASAYDVSNIHALTKLLPAGVSMDPNNGDLITLVELMGDSFDEYWAAIRQVTAINNRFESDLQNYSTIFLRQYLTNIGGMQFYTPYTNANLYAAYTTELQYYNPESPVLSITQYQKMLLTRFVANMPFLLRSKGTKTFMNQIFNIYGFSDRLITVKEYSKNTEAANLVTYGVASSLTLISNKTASISIPAGLLTGSNAIIVDLRITGYTGGEIIKTSGSVTSSVYDSDINQFSDNIPLTAVWGNYGTACQFKLYNHDSTLSVLHQDVFNSTCNSIHFYAGVSIDTIRIVSASAWTASALDYYLLGNNVVDDEANILSHYNFNLPVPCIQSSIAVTVSYGTESITTGPIQRAVYSSIFDNYPPNSHVKIAQPTEFTASLVEIGTKSAVYIGTNYSDQFNTAFTHDINNSIVNAIQNNKHEVGNNQSFKAYYKSLNDQNKIIAKTPYQTMVAFNEQIDSTVIKTIKDFNPAFINARYGTVLENPLYYRSRIGTVDMTVSSVLPQLVDSININTYTTLDRTGYYPKIDQLAPISVDTELLGNISNALSTRPVSLMPATHRSALGMTMESYTIEFVPNISSAQMQFIIADPAQNNNYLRKINCGYNYNYGIQTREVNMRDLYRLSRLSGSSVETWYYGRTTFYTNDERSQFLHYSINRGSKDGTVTTTSYVSDRKLIIDQGSRLSVTDPIRGIKL